MKGIALPIRVNGRGGVQTTQGTPLTSQIIMSGLSPCRSKNPFQAGNGVELGIPSRIVFAINSQEARNLAESAIERAFVRWDLAGVAKLQTGEEGLKMETSKGELIARVQYVDLEADSGAEVEKNLTKAMR